MNAVLADAAAEAPTLLPLKGLRASIARNMAVAWQAPRVAMGVEVDMTRCQARLAALQAEAGPGVRITVTALMLRAIALVLRRHPRLNALVRDEGIELVPEVHLGLAVALDEGLAVPVLRAAHTQSVAGLAAEMRALAVGARAGQLPTRAYQGATFTVTNLGMTGIDWFTPVLNRPQVGILGISRVADRVVAHQGQAVVRPMTTLTLVFDHRAVDGYPAGQFLDDLRALLESGEGL